MIIFTPFGSPAQGQNMRKITNTMQKELQRILETLNNDPDRKFEVLLHNSIEPKNEQLPVKVQKTYHESTRMFQSVHFYFNPSP
jgi:hypothetical protein